MKSKHWIKNIAVAALLVVPLTGCGLHGKPRVERREEGPSRPLAAAIDAEAAPELDSHGGASVVAPGIVEPWGGQVGLSAKEPGWIAAILVEEGELVQEGQLLAVLEDGAQRHSVELATALVAEAEADLLRMERGATAEELRQAKAEHDGARARAEYAQTAASRTRRLHAEGTVPDNEAERAVAEALAQAAAAERASARLEEMLRGATEEDREAARARLEAARARLQLAEADAARRRVTAPRPGTLLLSRFHAGEFFAPGSEPLMVLGDLSRLQVRLEVDEIDAPDVRVGVACIVVSDSGERLAGGTIVRVAPRMGRRALPIESPTARADVRVREVFVEIPSTAPVVPGQRVWGQTARTNERKDNR
jgi:multidrug resistance efflux pump